MKTVRIISFAAAAAGCVVLAACNQSASSKAGNVASAHDAEQAAPAVVNVGVSEAVLRPVPQTEVYSSTVQANAVNNIAPQSVNRIQKINVEVGDYVHAGQVLAEMDHFTLDQAKLKLNNDESEFSRLKGLYEEGGISKSDYESMELAYNVSKSSYKNTLDNTILRSPVTGVVTARNYDRGDMYSMGQPIFVVQQITPVKILVGISEADYTKVAKGDKVTITADALPGVSFDGQINRIYPVMDAASHTFNAEVLVKNDKRELRPGMYARVTVTFGVNNSIVIPDSAVIKQQGSGQRSVFVLNDDNTVTSVIVTLGRHIGSEYEILSGLNAGDQVVVKGITALRSGAAVNVIE